MNSTLVFQFACSPSQFGVKQWMLFRVLSNYVSHAVLSSAYLAQQGLQIRLAAIRYGPNYIMEQIELKAKKI